MHPPPRVKATGNSKSWNKTRKLMANIFNQFIQTQSSGIKVETDLDLSKVRLAYGEPANEYEEELINPILWEHLAGYLTETYKIPKGKKNGDQHLKSEVIQNYFQNMMQLVKTSLGPNLSENAKEFFTKCETSERKAWVDGVRNNMGRLTMQRDLGSDNKIVNKAPPIGLTYVKQIIQTYSACPNQPKKNAEIILAIKTTWLASGRGSEVSYLKFPRDFDYDPEFGTIARLPQPKTTEYKNVLLTASPCRHLDWYLAFADFFILNNEAFVGPGDAFSLIPAFAGVKNRSSKLSDTIKAVAFSTNESEGTLPQRKSRLYGYHKQLPAGVCANSLRRGSVDLLASRMPLVNASATSGHKIREKAGNIVEYIGADNAKLVPGYVTLHGFRSPQWGQLGPGVKPPNTECLHKISNLATKQNLRQLAINLFQIDRFEYPHAIRHDACENRTQPGNLFVIIECSLASLIMHFEERHNACEMTEVQNRLKQSFHFVFNREDPVATDCLKRWSAAIRDQFYIDNIHYISCAAHAGTTMQVAGTTMQDAGTTMQDIANGIQHLSKMIDTYTKLPRLNNERLQKIQNDMAALSINFHRPQSQTLPQLPQPPKKKRQRLVLNGGTSKNNDNQSSTQSYAPIFRGPSSKKPKKTRFAKQLVSIY